tara:strand:- start:3736 stop:3963 length:228 start_codon:yes stop_codon:yes gene_type:complete
MEHTSSWPELAIGLYEKLTDRNAEIIYEFENFRMYVPSGVGPGAAHAAWQFNGILKIRTRNLDEDLGFEEQILDD